MKAYVDLAHEYGAITVVDAVHYAAHKPIDVKAIGTDILVCSAYKFFGPHVGVMYVRKDLGESIKSVRVYAEDNADMPTKRRLVLCLLPISVVQRLLLSLLLTWVRSMASASRRSWAI